MSAILHILEGRIPDADFSALADLETRRVLQAHLLIKLGQPMPTKVFTPSAK
jgi:hypothetical protein